MTPHDKDDLEEELLRRYEECGKLGYWAKRSKQLFTKGCKHYIGGFEAVRRTIRKANRKPTQGLELLLKKDRLDLSDERLVLDKAWTHLFTDEDRLIAQQNLARYSKMSLAQKNRAAELNEQGVDEAAVKQANDNPAWDSPVRVKRSKATSVSISNELAARAALLANLHRESRLDGWVERVLRERVEIEELALIRAKKELGS